MKWAVIRDYPKYEVSMEGKVRRGDRERKQTLNQGYVRINISSNGIPKQKLVHRLVAEAFIPKVEGLNIVNHIDGNKQNNKITNLEWCCHTKNMAHAKEYSLMARGSEHPRAKLTMKKAKLIREMYSWSEENKISARVKPFDQRWLARCFKVDQKSIVNILKNRTWLQ